jgi:hypothetical protein
MTQNLSLDPPTFSAQRLTLLVTGSVNAALVPYWLHWLAQAYPNLETSVLVTRTAEQFVTIPALSALVTGDVWRDSWDEPKLPKSPHIELVQRSDCFAVFPATLHTTMRLAQGSCESPALMSLQLTRKPVVIAPSFPGTNEIIEHHRLLLSQRPNVAFSRAVPAFSVGQRSWGGETGFFLPLVLEKLEELLGTGNE